MAHLPINRMLAFFNNLAIPLAIFLVASSVSAQKSKTPSDAELSSITNRGRLLYHYDFAAWHATDSVQAINPSGEGISRYVARNTDKGWVVTFGRINDARDKFLIAYEATQTLGSQEFKARRCDPLKEDSDFYLLAAKAIDTALKDFQGQKRPYNVAVLPAASNQLYVYVLPAQTVDGIYPLGGDVRYLISADGSTIVEKRQMHKTILEFKSSDSSVKTEGGIHTHVLSELPEDSDVFYVLTRKPSVPEYIGTKQGIFIIKTDGSIVRGK